DVTRPLKRKLLVWMHAYPYGYRHLGGFEVDVETRKWQARQVCAGAFHDLRGARLRNTPDPHMTGRGKRSIGDIAQIPIASRPQDWNCSLPARQDLHGKLRSAGMAVAVKRTRVRVLAMQPRLDRGNLAFKHSRHRLDPSGNLPHERDDVLRDIGVAKQPAILTAARVDKGLVDVPHH